MIAIVGASGALGGDVARRLLAGGHQVAAITRSAGKVQALASLGADVRVADLADRDSLEAALRGTTAVFAAAHSLLGRGRYDSRRIDDGGHRALIDAAKAQDVALFVYTSVLGAQPTHPVAFWRTKFEIEEYLKASGLTFTILRPAAFMETHAHELLGRAIVRGGTAVILGPGNRPMNFVAVRDVATIATIALTTADTHGATIEIGGPENLTRNEVAARYARASGQPLRVRHLPLGLIQFFATILRPIHPGISGVMDASVRFESIDQSFDPSETLRRFPTTLTTLDAFVRERIDAAKHSGAR